MKILLKQVVLMLVVAILGAIISPPATVIYADAYSESTYGSNVYSCSGDDCDEGELSSTGENILWGTVGGLLLIAAASMLVLGSNKKRAKDSKKK